MTSRARRERLSAGERRGMIMREAGRLFARDGYAAATLEDIAAAAQVTKPMVYRHFESKKALYLALLARHEEDLPTFFERADKSSGNGSPDAALRTILGRWFDYVHENQHAWVMLFRDSSGDEEIRAFRRRVSERAREVLGAFIAAQPGDRIPARQVEPTAELLRAGLAGLALWWIDHPGVSKRILVDVAARMSAPAILHA